AITQHELARSRPSNGPPIDRGAERERSRTMLEPETLAEEPTEGDPQTPPAHRAVPAIVTTHTREVRADGGLQASVDGELDPHGRHAVHDVRVALEEVVRRPFHLAIEGLAYRVRDADRMHTGEGRSCVHGIAHDDLRREALDERMADGAVDRRHGIDPVRGEAGRQQRHVDDEAATEPARLRVRLDHVAICRHLVAAELVHARRDRHGAFEVVEKVTLTDGLDACAHPTRTHHERKTLGEVPEHLERDAARADDDRSPKLDDRYPSRSEQGTDLLTAREVLGGGRVTETAEVHDPLEPGRGGGTSERECKSAIAVAKAFLLHRMDQVERDVYTTKRLGHPLLVVRVALDELDSGSRQARVGVSRDRDDRVPVSRESLHDRAAHEPGCADHRDARHGVHGHFGTHPSVLPGTRIALPDASVSARCTVPAHWTTATATSVAQSSTGRSVRDARPLRGARLGGARGAPRGACRGGPRDCRSWRGLRDPLDLDGSRHDGGGPPVRTAARVLDAGRRHLGPSGSPGRCATSQSGTSRAGDRHSHAGWARTRGSRSGPRE